MVSWFPALSFCSPPWLIRSVLGGWDFLNVPWLAGIVALFAFEFVEGNTVTRLYFMRLRRLTQDALTAGAVTPQIAKARAELYRSISCFRTDLDVRSME